MDLHRPDSADGRSEENGLTEKINRIIYSALDGRTAPLKPGPSDVHILMGNRSMVGRRTLTPLIKVRILVPQPNKIKHLQALNLVSGLRFSVIVINL